MTTALFREPPLLLDRVVATSHRCSDTRKRPGHLSLKVCVPHFCARRSVATDALRDRRLRRAFHLRAEDVVEKRTAEMEVCEMPHFRRLSGTLNDEMAISESP